ncbi:DUF5979 domain-containing protein [Demequina litorisediminis]|uniref:DUF5979 domain-containing protein n=1 Tax=Demequina litorisediminis TaxID=1849022 RepID=UPI0024E12589|nr:DUF5979 domain-containing protein [Demequina litorisediminis]
MAAQCTAPWGDDVGTLEETAAVDGATAALEGLPVGSTCGVDVHGDDLAQVSASRSTIVVSEPAAAEVAVVTSVKGADLRIRRAVTGDVTQAWEREAVTATCTAAGREIFATGFDQDKPMRFLLAVDEEVSAQLLPIGSECLVTDASGITVLATIGERGGDADFASFIPFADDEPREPTTQRGLAATGPAGWVVSLAVAGAIAVAGTLLASRRRNGRL